MASSPGGLVDHHQLMDSVAVPAAAPSRLLRASKLLSVVPPPASAFLSSSSTPPTSSAIAGTTTRSSAVPERDGMTNESEWMDESESGANAEENNGNREGAEREVDDDDEEEEEETVGLLGATNNRLFSYVNNNSHSNSDSGPGTGDSSAQASPASSSSERPPGPGPSTSSFEPLEDGQGSLEELVPEEMPFPSVLEEEEGGGAGIAIGLGVDSTILSSHERRRQLRSIEDSVARQHQQHSYLVDAPPTLALSTEISVMDGSGWKELVAVDGPDLDEIVGDTEVGAGVGGSTHSTPLVPFPSFEASPSSRSLHLTPILPSSPLSCERELPPLPDSRPVTPASQTPRSPRPSTTSVGTNTSSDSSTLSLPTVPPVDLTLPNHAVSSGPYMSVANGPMARLAADGTSGGSRPTSSRGPRAFFSNLLGRTPRSPTPNTHSSPSSANSSPSTSPMFSSGSFLPSLGLGVPRSPSAPSNLSSSPTLSPVPGGIASAQAQWQASHGRSSSLPSPDLGSVARGFAESRSSLSSNPANVSNSEIPDAGRRELLGASGLSRSATNGFRAPISPLSSSTTSFAPPPTASASAQASSPPRSRPIPPPISTPSSPLPSNHISTSVSPPSALPAPPVPERPSTIPPTLASAGLNLVPLTQQLSLSRNSQPLCGAILDNKYILIGTTGGLDFLPIPLPGSLPMRSHGKKRRDTRKPIPLIKRTRFKDLAVLSERSNILLAIAGRNDHIRVYALDGIRSMIEKKMNELDIRDGYPVIPDPSILLPPKSTTLKGKARADLPPVPPLPPSLQQTFPSRPAPTPSVSGTTSSSSIPRPPSPPPDYSFGLPPPPSPRRHSPLPSPTTSGPLLSPVSPTRMNARPLSSANSVVRAIPTNPKPATIRSSSSSTSINSTPRTIRGQKSRDFVASRRGSTTASIPRRKSRVDLHETSSIGGGSRRSSVVSGDERAPPLPPMAPGMGARRGSTGGLSGRRGSVGSAIVASFSKAKRRVPRVVTGGNEGEEEEEEIEDGGDEAEGLYPPKTTRRPSAASTSGSGEWTSESSPVLRSGPKFEARRPSVGDSSIRTSELAEFLKTTGPSPVPEEGSFATPGGRNFRFPSVDLASTTPTESFRLPGTPSSINGPSASSKLPRDPTTIGRSAATYELAEFLRNDSASKGKGVGATDGRRGSAASAVSAISAARRASEMSIARRDSGDSVPRRASEASVQRRGSASTTGSQSGRLEPRGARSPLLRQSERSSAMDLAEVLRETGPAPEMQEVPRRPSAASLGNRKFDTLPRSASAPIGGLTINTNFSNPFDTSSRLPIDHNDPKGKSSVRRPSTADDIAPEDVENSLAPPRATELRRTVSARARMVARPATTNPSTEDSPAEGSDPDRAPRRPGMTLEEVIRMGPAEPSPVEADVPESPASASAAATKASKRWTMTNMSQKLLNKPEGNLLRAPSPTSPSPSPPRPGSSEEAPRRTSLQWDGNDPLQRGSPTSTIPVGAPLPPPPPLASTPLPPHDFKRSQSDLQTERPTLPSSSQMPPDPHPANSSSPLEYVKLARTKGARLLRAVETKKRTYLAVLCGDEGERIELFTGSRSISLSLNRTFVLPENPRTIEFQIQGDDLIDIYLVYPESIFALEPATVRVREVGVGRGERRARRERERRMRDLASQSPAEGNRLAPLDSTASSTLHPADPALTEGRPPRTPSPGDDSQADFDPLAPGDGPQAAHEDDNIEATARSSTSSRQAPGSRGQPQRDTPLSGSRTKLPYTTFQQLGFVPPVPSSVLASAWIIPPLYTDVVAGQSPTPQQQPFITVTEAPPPDFLDQPLLSPISLLGGAAQRANGPPGLFFVSKGRNLSGIVTGDGRSVIKKPLVWNLDRNTESEIGDVYRRIEMVIVGGTRTVVVGVGTTEVKAIAVEGEAGQPPFGTAIPVTPTPGTRPGDSREVEFLGNHLASNQLFFTERVGQNWRVWCIGAAA